MGECIVAYGRVLHKNVGGECCENVSQVLTNDEFQEQWPVISGQWPVKTQIPVEKPAQELTTDH